MSPLFSGLGAPGQLVADGATVSFAHLGKPPSKLKRGAEKQATLTLSGRFMERVREPGDEEERDLAKLKGSMRVEDDGSFVFAAKQLADGTAEGLQPTEAVGDDDDVSEDDPREVRLMRFAFDGIQFEGLGGREPLELALRVDAARFDYCEVSVKLEVGGSVEADRNVNDTLDVLITPDNPTPRELVTVRFVDEAGDPMPSAAVAISSGAKPVDASADPTALTADGNGELRLRNVAGSVAAKLAWGSSADDLRFRKLVFLVLGEDANARRLQNVGYPERELPDNVLSFQADFARPSSGRIADIADELKAFHDDGARPALGDATEPSTEAVAINGPRTTDFDDLRGARTDDGVALA
jgi:hypothetical protein